MPKLAAATPTPPSTPADTFRPSLPARLAGAAAYGFMAATAEPISILANAHRLTWHAMRYGWHSGAMFAGAAMVAIVSPLALTLGSVFMAGGCAWGGTREGWRRGGHVPLAQVCAEALAHAKSRPAAYRAMAQQIADGVGDRKERSRIIYATRTGNESFVKSEARLEHFCKQMESAGIPKKTTYALYQLARNQEKKLRPLLAPKGKTDEVLSGTVELIASRQHVPADKTDLWLRNALSQREPHETLRQSADRMDFAYFLLGDFDPNRWEFALRDRVEPQHLAAMTDELKAAVGAQRLLGVPPSEALANALRQLLPDASPPSEEAAHAPLQQGNLVIHGIKIPSATPK